MVSCIWMCIMSMLLSIYRKISPYSIIINVVFGVCWSLTSLCHSNGHIETMPAREINPFTALTRIRSQFLRTQWSTSNHQRVDMTTPHTAQQSGLAYKCSVSIVTKIPKMSMLRVKFMMKTFLYENLVKLYELKILYVHCITHNVTKNTLVILNIILSVDKYTS